MTDLNDTLVLNDKFTTASGLPMAEYVPQDYPRSDVVYSHMPTGMALGQTNGPNPTLPPLPAIDGAYVAGGYAADLLINCGFGKARDVDVFFNSREAFEKMFDRLTELGYALDSQCLSFIDPATKKLIWTEEFEKQVPYVEFHPPFELRHQYGEKTVQLVKIRWYDSAEHVIDAFDFTVVAVAFDLGAWECFFNPLAPLHYAHRVIVQHRVESRARVLLRLQKYKDKGFKPTDAFVIPPDTTVDQHPVHDTQKVEF
jgi:hypothetical protein